MFGKRTRTKRTSTRRPGSETRESISNRARAEPKAYQVRQVLAAVERLEGSNQGLPETREDFLSVPFSRLVRARVEHLLGVVKRQFGLVKTRFRGLAKNTAQLVALFALANLYLVRKRLLALTGKVRPQFT
jgi:IS5 family transposase